MSNWIITECAETGCLLTGRSDLKPDFYTQLEARRFDYPSCWRASIL